MLTDGQAAETALGYAALSTEVAWDAVEMPRFVTIDGSPIWP